MTRNEKIIQLRPKLNLEIAENKNHSENFMHVSLRPILKLQHEVVCLLISQQKRLNLDLLNGKTKSDREKRTYLSAFISKNPDLKNQLIGMIIGMLSTEEMADYAIDKKSSNKRITDMIVTRYLSTLN